MNNLYQSIVKIPLGYVHIYSHDTAITHTFLSRQAPENIIESPRKPAILNQASEQLEAYFKGQRQQFDLMLEPQGTDFQRQCWNALLNIPYGTTISYREQAEQINNPKACRAVGSANGRNPIPIFIPCHRVIQHNGNLGGYSAGLPFKEQLLALEHTFSHREGVSINHGTSK